MGQEGVVSGCSRMARSSERRRTAQRRAEKPLPLNGSAGWLHRQGAVNRRINSGAYQIGGVSSGVVGARQSQAIGALRSGFIARYTPLRSRLCKECLAPTFTCVDGCTSAAGPRVGNSDIDGPARPPSVHLRGRLYASLRSAQANQRPQAHKPRFDRGILSPCLLCFVPQLAQDGDDAVAMVALDFDGTRLDRPAHAEAVLQQLQ